MSDDSSSSASANGVRQRQRGGGGGGAAEKAKAYPSSSDKSSKSSSSSSDSADSSERSTKKPLVSFAEATDVDKDAKRKKDDSGSTSDGDDAEAAKMEIIQVKDSDDEKQHEIEKPKKKSNKGKDKAPPKREKGKERASSSESESKSAEKPKPTKNLGRSGRDNLKKSWKEDDLEIIVPDSEEGSADSSDDGDAVAAGPAVDYFAWVPDEVILNVYGYLDEQMIGRAAQVNSRWNKLTFDDDMWQEKAQAWGYIPKNQLAPGRERSYYVQKFLDQKTADKRAKDAAERNRRDTKKRNAADWMEVVLVLCFFNRVVDYISIFCLILTTIFATLKLGSFTFRW